jgi:hypothetical protein
MKKADKLFCVVMLAVAFVLLVTFCVRVVTDGRIGAVKNQMADKQAMIEAARVLPEDSCSIEREDYTIEVFPTGKTVDNCIPAYNERIIKITWNKYFDRKVYYEVVVE